MNKQKLLRGLLATCGALALVAGIAFLTFWLVKNQQTKTNSPPPSSQPAKQPTAEAPTLNPQEIATQQKTLATFDEVSKAYNQKNHKQTITLAVAYGASSSNDSTSRLSAYDMCIRSAVSIGDVAAKDDCLAKGTALVQSLPDAEAKAGWTAVLQTAVENKVDVGSPDSGQLGSQ